ncbi:hypothetical protein GCM10011614_18800 [Novosphingobium colocasiae]|uniref:TonB-dependent receptor plug domain-containing protein n=2 Tax=Novosphingobium colocasiae TaxID=1256513 RepID=A0A918PEK8_9SPHN|nr:hypothetical protein GCM10011614_18800 [Novosphingobium colocasiae]
MANLRNALRAGGSFGLALLAGMPVMATAQTPDATDAASSSAGGEIIVTAQRKSETLEKTPVAVSVVSSKALAEQAVTSERDLQFAAPGLTVRASQSDNQLNFSLRGQTVDVYTSSLPSVLPYVNEVQVGGAGSTAFYDLQSVQVLKGPQGTLFGRNATGGAVLFTTAKPTDQFEGYARARYGRFDDVQLEGAINVPLAPDVALLRVAGVYRTRDGLQKNLFYGNRLGEIDRQGVRASLTLFPNGPFKNELMVDYYHAGGSSMTPVVSYVVPVANNVPGNPFVTSNVFFPDLAAFADAQKKRGPFVVDVDSVGKHRTNKWIVSNISTLDLGDDLQLKNVFGYVHSKYFDAGDIDGTRFGIDGRGNEDTGAFGGDGKIRQVSEELQLLGKALDGRLDFVVGGYYSNSREHLVNTSFILNGLGLPAQINAGTTTSKTIAGYGQATLDTGLAGFKLTAGLRYTSEKIEFVRDDVDQYSPIANPAWIPFYADGRFIAPQQDTFKKLSWTFGLQNQVTSDLLLYANTRRSFRSGGFNFHAPPTPGFANTSGGEFRPEVATDVEMGAKYRGYAGDMPVRLNLAAYTMWIKNVQRANYVAIYDGLAGITVNVPKAKVSGIEADGNIQPAPWLSMGGNINYTDAKFTSNRVAVLGTGGGTSFANFDTYPDTPKWSGAVYADVTVPANENLDVKLHGDLFAQTSNYFSSTGKSLNPHTRIPGYALANFRLGVEQKDKGFSIAALVKNAFDKRYYTGGIGFASLFALNVVIPGEPRTYMVEVGYKF